MMTRQQKKEHLIKTYKAFVRLFFAYLEDRYGIETEDGVKYFWRTSKDGHKFKINGKTGEIVEGFGGALNGKIIWEYQEQPTNKEIHNFFKNALSDKQTKKDLYIGEPCERLIKKGKENGYNIEYFQHYINSDGIRHANDGHGEGNEIYKDQQPINEKDFERVYQIVTEYDDVLFKTEKEEGSNKIKRTIKYSKAFPEGTCAYVEQICNRGHLSTVTMYKKKK